MRAKGLAEILIGLGETSTCRRSLPIQSPLRCRQASRANEVKRCDMLETQVKENYTLSHHLNPLKRVLVTSDGMLDSGLIVALCSPVANQNWGREAFRIA